MGAPPTSQVAPLPTNLPFRLVSKTIGSGAYASIRKAAPKTASTPVIAVKFINKEHAFRTGRLRPKQIQLELSLHKHVTGHPNIIRFHNHGEDTHWIWLAMELAEGGDLFDKIEADEGVNEDIAHLYFSQLVAALRWCHGKGVSHRDIKPENMLLSSTGDLKLADFGLATQFLEPSTGKRKVCSMVCGSPPYIAPEILAVGQTNLKRKSAEQEKAGYNPDTADIWSCAIVLFVLFAGNTPWDSPDAAESWEYNEYIKTNGQPTDELWQKIPSDALSLITGMLRVDSTQRMDFLDVAAHPWTKRPNRYLSRDGRTSDPLGLATTMLEKLHINFNQAVPLSQGDRMEFDSPQAQADTPSTDLTFDWEEPPFLGASQSNNEVVPLEASFLDRLAEEPSMSQFSSTPSVPLSLTQVAREFNDIMPSHSMTRFVSTIPLPDLIAALTSALRKLGASITPLPGLGDRPLDEPINIRVKTEDRKQPLHGHITVQHIQGGVHEVRFAKAKGDPLSWRRFFKHVAVLCKDAILRRDF